MKAAIYARVSTPDQHIETQICQLRELALKRGFEIVGEYKDNGFSGTKARRPGLDALMADAHRRRFTVVLVAAFDRVARSTRHFLQLLDELESFGIAFVSARESFDTSGPLGRLFLTLIASISALELDLLRDRIRQGMKMRKLAGFRLGRAPLDIDHDALVRDRLSGMSLTQVAKKYSISRASVVRFVRVSQQQLAGNDFIQPVEAQATAQPTA
jgi:DNA invertase Pin-like site-specific DNA recombinase